MKRNDFVWARAIFLQPMNPIGQNGSTQFSSNLSHSYWVSGSESFPESVPTPNNSLRRVRTRMNGVHFPLWYAPIAPRFSSTCCFQNPRPSFLIHRIPNSTHHPRKEISYSSTMGRGFVTVKAQMTTDEKKISDDRMLVYVPPHPLIKHWVSVLRNEQTPCAIFKSAMGELGRILMYEASRDWLPIVAGEIQSPMGVASVEFIDPREPVAVVPILRAGLALVEHALSILPAIKTYHLGVSRDEETLQPTVYLNKLPESFPEGSRVFVVDPMLATGGTMVAALNLLKERGVGNKQIKVISAVAAPPALQKLSEKFPGIHVYTGIIDPIVNEKGFIIPGLGDAGDRSFGT